MKKACYRMPNLWNSGRFGRTRNGPQDNENVHRRPDRSVRAVVDGGSRRDEKDPAPRETLVARLFRRRRDHRRETDREEKGGEEGRLARDRARRRQAGGKKSAREASADDQAALSRGPGRPGEWLT